MAGRGKGGFARQLPGNSCLRYAGLYLISLVLVVVVLAGGLTRFIPGLGSSQPPSIAAVTPATPAPTAAGPAPNTGGSLPATAPTAGVQSVPLPSTQGGNITPYFMGAFYIVQPGDTLDGIAAQFGTTAAAIRDYNRLPNDSVNPGQVLYLPPASYNPVPNTGRNAGHDSGAPADSGDTNTQP